MHLKAIRDMWRSGDDIAKDLATLNDFGIPGDEEPYKFLYSMGRGSKIRQKKKPSENFIDSRTGEVINVKDALLDIPDSFCKSKGRGNLLGTYSKSKLQLQQQLRLARPLGSGDEAVESYYGRNKPMKKAESPINLGDSETDIQNQETASENISIDSATDKTRLRVKAIRNSSSQSNALITNLLSKAKADPNLKLINGSCNIDNSSNCNVDFNIKLNDHSKFKEEKNINDFNFQDAFITGLRNETKVKEKRHDTHDQNTESDNVEHENFKIEITQKEEDKSNCKNMLEKKNETEVEYWSDSKKKYVTALETDCMNKLSIYDNPVAVPLLYKKDDFPPLRRK